MLSFNDPATKDLCQESILVKKCNFNIAAPKDGTPPDCMNLKDKGLGWVSTENQNKTWEIREDGTYHWIHSDNVRAVADRMLMDKLKTCGIVSQLEVDEVKDLEKQMNHRKDSVFKVIKQHYPETVRKYQKFVQHQEQQDKEYVDNGTMTTSAP